LLNELAIDLYQVASDKGFHSGEPKLPDFLMNLHAEISELWEAHRESKLNSPCNKAEGMIKTSGEALTCLEEELADILIRTLDTSKSFGVDIDRAVRIKTEYNKTRSFRHGGKIA